MFILCVAPGRIVIVSIEEILYPELPGVVWWGRMALGWRSVTFMCVMVGDARVEVVRDQRIGSDELIPERTIHSNC